MLVAGDIRSTIVKRAFDELCSVDILVNVPAIERLTVTNPSDFNV